MRRRHAAKAKGASPPIPTTLDRLAERIREVNSLAISTIRHGLGHARECGELLNQAKKLVGHGGWQDWVRDNTDLKLSTARAYMRIGKIPHDEWESFQGQPIEEVLQSIGQKPKTKDKPATDPAPDDEPTGLEWTAPENPDAELLEHPDGGVVEEAEPEPEPEEYHTVSQAELLIKQAIRLVGLAIVKKLVAKLEKEPPPKEGGTVH